MMIYIRTNHSQAEWQNSTINLLVNLAIEGAKQVKYYKVYIFDKKIIV